MCDRPMVLLTSSCWALQRLKSTASQQRGVVDRMMSAGNIKFLLLLTGAAYSAGLTTYQRASVLFLYSNGSRNAGTPIQNNLRELYGLLSLLDASTYRSEEEFSEKFGGKNAPPTIAQVKALQVHDSLSSSPCFRNMALCSVKSLQTWTCRKR